MDYRYICNRPLNPLTVRIVILNYCNTCYRPFNRTTVGDQLTVNNQSLLLLQWL